MKLRNLYLVAVLASALAVVGCGDEGGGGEAGSGGTGGVNADAECSVELCAEDSDLGRAAKAACIDEIESCLTTGKFSEQECIAFGVETCSADAG